MARNLPQNVENVENDEIFCCFVTFSVISYLRLENSIKQKLRKGQDD